ncbi:MAG: T9SS type A sorting domain-containing protein [Bacteroidetes bacterium]|nr:T9SS type A sorting domain-containing protein [Bacteroidota bacterium]
MNNVPTNYQYIDEVYFPRNETPYYIDYSVIGEPSYWPGLGNVSRYPIRYYVKAVDRYGTYSVPSDFGDAVGLVPDEGGKEKDGLGRPGSVEVNLEYKLNQNYPNPFNPVTNIVYEIKNEGLVILKIYDIAGREITTLVDQIKQPGSYLVKFDGSFLSSGIYFYSLRTSSGIITKKMLLAK